MALSKNFRERPHLAAAALSAARNLVTTEEAVLGQYLVLFRKDISPTMHHQSTQFLSTIYHILSPINVGTYIFIEVMCTHGGMKLSSEILGYPSASSTLVRAMVGFMRNLCADDLRKETLGE